MTKVTSTYAPQSNRPTRQASSNAKGMARLRFAARSLDTITLSPCSEQRERGSGYALGPIQAGWLPACLAGWPDYGPDADGPRTRSFPIGTWINIEFRSHCRILKRSAGYSAAIPEMSPTIIRLMMHDANGPYRWNIGTVIRGWYLLILHLNLI